MISLVRMPNPPLNALVQTLVYNSNYNPAYGKEILLPDGGIDLIIDLTEKPKHVYDNQVFTKKQTCRDGWISGVRNHRIVIDSGKNLDPCLVVIRFQPGGARPFFKFPLVALRDEVVDLDVLWGQRFKFLREELGSLPTPEAVLQRLERILLDWAGNQLEPDHCMHHAATMLARMKKPLTVKQLTQHIGYSQKHFIKLFEKHIGLSPKRFSRIMRFQHVVRDLERGEPKSWSQFAQTYGFYDQAHFINEFKAYAGMTPTRYLQAKGEYLNYLPLFDG